MHDTHHSSPGDAAAQAALAHLRTTCRSAVLASVNPDGSPDASYAPVAESDLDDGAFLIVVSELARHTGNLVRTRRVSALLIEDEASAGQIFARRRATFECRIEIVERGSAAWRRGFETLEARHGAAVKMLRELSDFQLLRLVPERGTLVLGFGRAWRLSGPRCDALEAIGPP